MGMKQLLPCLLGLLLSSCALKYDSLLTTGGIPNIVIQESSVLDLQSKELKDLPAAINKPTVAVYPNSFKDLTGQRKSNSEFALFSTAITQAPEAFLIRAFKHAANGEFFKVVERVGLDDLTKERQLIRTTRKEFKEDNKLKPLLFAGLLVQGGVISYDTNTSSGGLGARYLGIGLTKEYRQDTVVVSLRTVSVSTGKVLTEVLTTKTILSVALSQDAFRFISDNTELVEIENGMVENESVNIALQHAVETVVLETIKLGIKKNLWSIPSEELLNRLRG